MELSNEVLKAELDALGKRIDLAFSNADKAIQKAEFSTEKRFESVNEFRAQLSDQTKTFINRSEYNISHNALADKVDLISSQVISIDSVLRNKPQQVSGSTLFFGASSVIVVVILAIIGG